MHSGIFGEEAHTKLAPLKIKKKTNMKK